MADVVGLFAAGIQVVDATAKLKGLWNDVKNAPEDLTDCVNDIQHTAKLLAISKQLISSSCGVNDKYLSDYTRNLDEALTALRDVTLDLQKKRLLDKRLGNLKIFLKRDDIARGRCRLETAQKHMNFAHQNLLLALQLQQSSTSDQTNVLLRKQLTISNENNLLLQQLTAPGQSDALQQLVNFVVQNTLQQALSTSSNSSHVILTTSNEQTKISDTGTLEPQHMAHCSQPNLSISKKASKSYSLRFPWWLTRRCFELVYCRELCSLQFSLTSYTVVSSASPEYRAVETGDLDGLRRIFETEKINLFNHNEFGNTLLEEALLNQKTDIAYFLITQCPSLGVKLSVRKVPAMFEFWGCVPLERDILVSIQKFAQIWNLVTECIDVDEDMISNVGSSWSSLRFSGMTDIFGGNWTDWLLYVPKAASQGIRTLPKEARMALARVATNPHLFRQLLDTDILMQEFLEVCTQVGHHLLLYTVLGEPDRWPVWSSIVQEVLAFEKLRETSWDWDSLALGTMWNHKRLITMPSLRPAAFKELLQQWIRYLQNLDVDMVYYAQRETSALMRCPISDGYWRSIGLIHGPEAVDWEVLFAPDETEYEHAGQFWDWIENPELYFIPGSFHENKRDFSTWWRNHMLEEEQFYREGRRLVKDSKYHIPRKRRLALRALV